MSDDNRYSISIFLKYFNFMVNIKLKYNPSRSRNTHITLKAKSKGRISPHRFSFQLLFRVLHGHAISQARYQSHALSEGATRIPSILATSDRSFRATGRRPRPEV